MGEKKDQTGLKGKKTLTKPTAMRDSFVYCLSLCDVSFGMEGLRIWSIFSKSSHILSGAEHNLAAY